MTVWAVRDGERTPNVKVTLNYGPIQAQVVEDFHYLRHFWSGLGSLLDEMEKEEKAKMESAEV